MKIILSLCCYALLLGCTPLSAQSTIYKTYYQPGYNYSGDKILPLTDGNYLVAGMYYDTAQVFEGAYLGYYLVKIKPNGDTIWTNMVPVQNVSGVFNIYQQPDSSFVLLGGDNPLYYATCPPGCQICTGFQTGLDQLTPIQISKTGNLVAKHTVLVVCTQAFVSALMDHDSVITSFTQGTNGQLVIEKTDLSANIIWSQVYDSLMNGAFLCKTYSSGYMGLSFSSAGFLQSSNLQLIRFNTVGDTVWSKVFTMPESQNPLKIIQTTDGNYLSASTYSYNFYNPNGGHYDSTMLVKTDTGGNVLWQRIYAYRFADIIVHDSGFVLLTDTAGTDSFYVISLDAGGRILSQQTYGIPTTELPTQIINTAAGYYITGTERSTTIPKTSVFVIIDSLPVNPTGISYLTQAENTLNVFPNPAIGRIHAEMTFDGKYEFKLFNMIGQQIAESETTKAFNFDTKQLSAGVYLITVGSKSATDNFIPQSFQKIVVQH